MIDIINTIKQKITESGTENVYSVFDAIPISSKGDFFTVIGIKNFEYSTPIYSHYTVYMPFKAEIEIKVLAPENSSMEKLYNYYESNISGIINNLSGLSNNISNISVKHDKNISRLVLNVIVSTGGMKKIERETEEQE